MRSQTLFSRRSRMIIRIKLRATHITLLVFILLCPTRLDHDTQVTQLSHSILPCGALYKLNPLETKGLNLVRFLKGCVHKHFSVAVVEWSYAITWSQKKKKKKKKKVESFNLLLYFCYVCVLSSGTFPSMLTIYIGLYIYKHLNT